MSITIEHDIKIKTLKKEMALLRRKLQIEYIAKIKKHILYLLKQNNVNILYFHTSDFVDRELISRQPTPIVGSVNTHRAVRLTNSFVSKKINKTIKQNSWLQIYLEISDFKKEDKNIFYSISELLNNYDHIEVSSFCIGKMVFDIFASPGSSIRKDRINIVIHSSTSEEIFKFLSKNKVNITLNSIIDSISKHEEIIEYQKKIVQETPQIFLNIGEKC